MRRIVFLLPLFLALSTALAADTVPDKFFRGIPQPDNTITLTYTCPTVLDRETVNREQGWWNACAKMELLTQRPHPNREFLQAYIATSTDPALAAIGVTYTEWSRGTPEAKLAARERIHVAVQAIVAKHRLRELLMSTPVDETLLAQRVVENHTKLAAKFSETTATVVVPLIKYCPGATDNVTINTQNPLFPKLMEVLKAPTTDQAYRTAVTAFNSYLDSHPGASETERNNELTRLMSPILDRVR